MDVDGTWRVGCHLAFDVTDPATLVLGVAPAATAGRRVAEQLQVTLDGHRVPVDQIDGPHGGLGHVLRSPAGHLQVAYEAVIEPSPRPVPAPVTRLDDELLTYLRPSRFCPSDLLNGLAAFELGHLGPGPELLAEVGIWVGCRLTYERGSSGPLDTAVDSLLAGKGVCRDFAHLAIAMLRAFEVPARLVSVYAPGLTPMDFHAVVEAHVDGRWHVLDPSRLAPRPSLVRVSTGRDAADTAFVTVLGGDAELLGMEVTAVTAGDLPLDDHTGLVVLQ